LSILSLLPASSVPVLYSHMASTSPASAAAAGSLTWGCSFWQKSVILRVQTRFRTFQGKAEHKLFSH